MIILYFDTERVIAVRGSLNHGVVETKNIKRWDRNRL